MQVELGPGVTNEQAVGLPPLSTRRRETWDYYAIEFLPDGYPGRRRGDRVQAHPLYGTYVITDFLGQYRATRNEAFLRAACRVADAAVARMTDMAGALVFRYEPDGGLTGLPTSFYSALTQARYLSAFSRLQSTLSTSRYADEAAAVLRSFHIPAQDGGVARRTPGGGLLVEEYSHSVPDYTLNGWTTATCLVHEYARARDDEEARQTFEDLVRGIADVLPLYDVPELANSRYRLTGPARIRLQFSHDGAAVPSGAVHVPGQGTYGLSSTVGKWTNGFVSGVGPGGHLVGREADMDVLLCRVSWPQPNRISLEVHAAEDGEVTAQIAQGPYHPLLGRSRPERYADLCRLPLVTGRNEVTFQVPWTAAELVAYPTTFSKRLGGRQYNVYHFIHIDTLAKLAAATGDDMLAYYQQKWASYPELWSRLPVYADADIVRERYGPPANA